MSKVVCTFTGARFSCRGAACEFCRANGRTETRDGWEAEAARLGLPGGKDLDIDKIVAAIMAKFEASGRHGSDKDDISPPLLEM